MLSSVLASFSVSMWWQMATSITKFNSKFKSSFEEPGPLILTIKSLFMSHWLKLNRVTIPEPVTGTTVILAPLDMDMPIPGAGSRSSSTQSTGSGNQECSLEENLSTQNRKRLNVCWMAGKSSLLPSGAVSSPLYNHWNGFILPLKEVTAAQGQARPGRWTWPLFV